MSRQHRIIAISRQFGSGGRELGRLIAEELDYAYYDREVIRQIVDDTKSSETQVKEVLNNPLRNLFPMTVGRTVMLLDTETFEQSQAIYQGLFNVLHRFAQKGNCVIVGRAADDILAEYKPLRIFVRADNAYKIARYKEAMEPGEKPLTDAEIIKKFTAVDRERSEFYRSMTDKAWGDLNNMDLIINTSNCSIYSLAHSIAEYIKALDAEELEAEKEALEAAKETAPAEAAGESVKADAPASETPSDTAPVCGESSAETADKED